MTENNDSSGAVTVTINGIPINGITEIDYRPLRPAVERGAVTPTEWTGSFEISRADGARLERFLGEAALGRYWYRRQLYQRARDRRRGIERTTYYLNPRQRRAWCEALGINVDSVQGMAMTVVERSGQ